MRGFSPTVERRCAARRFSSPSFPEERDRNLRNGVEVEAARCAIALSPPPRARYASMHDQVLVKT